MPISWSRVRPTPPDVVPSLQTRPDLHARLAARCQDRARQNLSRCLRTVEAVGAGEIVVEGRRLLNFSSNDYLGLARHPELISALRRSADEWGVGSTASALVCGYTRAHAVLEEALAEWTGRDRALLFSSGYLANLGTAQALLQRGDLCVQDKLNHASLLDAAALSGATLKRYPHGDVTAAARQLRSQAQAAALLVSDGVFSMDGDIAPLSALASLAASERALLLVDDAHGLGVCGPQGAGSVRAAGLDQDQVPLLIGTLGKALGGMGAFVAGRADVIEAVAQFARPHIYTTALPPAVAAATAVAVRLARAGDDLRARLAMLIARFRDGASQLGLPLLPSSTPIQPLLLGSAEAVLQAARQLESNGVLVGAIRPPTVPSGQARLRITLSALHSEAQVNRLLDALADLCMVRPAAVDDMP